MLSFRLEPGDIREHIGTDIYAIIFGLAECLLSPDIFIYKISII